MPEHKLFISTIPRVKQQQFWASLIRRLVSWDACICGRSHHSQTYVSVANGNND